jgi:hypothetical protein
MKQLGASTAIRCPQLPPSHGVTTSWPVLPQSRWSVVVRKVAPSGFGRTLKTEYPGYLWPPPEPSVGLKKELSPVLTRSQPGDSLVQNKEDSLLRRLPEAMDLRS